MHQKERQIFLALLCEKSKLYEKAFIIHQKNKTKQSCKKTAFVKLDIYEHGSLKHSINKAAYNTASFPQPTIKHI